nr:probable serine/threonine-protein kinase ndrD isoform X4 [Ipomoea batatas]
MQEEITSPLSAQLLEFCESELFPETAAAVQISEVGSSSNCCYEEHSSHSTGLSHTQDMTKFSGGAGAEKNDEIPTAGDNNTPATSGGGAANNNNNFSVFFDPQEDDISRSIDFNFTIPPQFLLDGQFDLSLLNGQGPVPNGGGQYPPEQPAGQLIPPPLPQPYEEECLSSVPSSYMPSCSILDYLPLSLPAENSGIFTGGAMFQPQELDFQADNNGSRLFCPDTISRPYNFSNDLQAVSSGAGSTSTPLASDITSLEDSTFKVGKLSVEQRKEKIHRYLKKRNERNFSKKIKYACRKTLADSRPRVRGRFAKNDEFGGSHGTPEEETITEDVRMSLLYDPNQAAAAALQPHNGGRIFAANCLPPPANPYEMCTNSLYCTDSQMR